MASIEEGQSKTITVTFTDTDGTAADPTAVTISVRAPESHTVTTYTYGADAELVKSSTGIYYIVLTFDEAGDWKLRWAGTGNVVAVDEETVSVRRSVFP